MAPDDARPVLSVYVVWHPAAGACDALARAMFKGLCADPDLPARRGLGIPVRFRTSSAPDQIPQLVPFGDALHTVAFVLADDTLLADPAWRGYAEGLVDAAGTDDLVIPVALTSTSSLPPKLGALQAIRLHDQIPELRPTLLLNDAMHDLSRRLDPEAAKVKVFLSHAKLDGLPITTTVRRHLHEVARLDDFFDAADIPDGTRFGEFVTECAGTLPALLAVQTDSYGSREWCRLEVLEAKRRRVPIVVLAAVKEGEARSFPYLGNVPVVRWRSKVSLPAVVGALLREVLRDRYFPLRVATICQHHGLTPESQVFTYPPELLTALCYRLEAAEAGTAVGKFLYPDPPLGSEELLLLHQLDPEIDPVTPTILLAS